MSTELIDEIRAIETSAIEQIATVDSVERLRELDTELFGKRSALNAFKKRLGGLDADGRRTVGRALNEARARACRGAGGGVETAFAPRREGIEADERARRIEAERLDLTEHRPTA